MPNPTTNPTRLSRTAREVAWNPLPGDAIRLPGGYLTTMSSAPDARERFLKALAQAPAGSTVLPYDGRPNFQGFQKLFVERFLVHRDLAKVRLIGEYWAGEMDRWLGCGGSLSPEAHAALDFTASLPEAPFVHHAANIVHCMVKFGAPAFVAAKPARDPRQNPQPGDVRISRCGRWTWDACSSGWARPYWRSQDGGVVWECGDAPAKEAPHHYAYATRHFVQPIPLLSVDWAPDRATVAEIVQGLLAARKSDAPAPRRCPRTDPRPGDLCILANDDVKVFKEGTYKLTWGIGGGRTRWIRGEDVVRG